MCRARWYLFRPSDSLTRDLSEFIRTDVLLACVRECVKNVHATYTHTHTVTNATHPDSVGSSDLLRVSFVCVRPAFHLFNPINQSGDSFHTSYHHLLRGIFTPFFLLSSFTRECQSPTFVRRGLFNEGDSHSTHTTAGGISNPIRPPSKDPPRLSCFWRRRLLARSLFLCRALSHYASDTLDENR